MFGTTQIRTNGTHLMISLRCPIFTPVKVDEPYNLSNFMPETETSILTYKYRIFRVPCLISLQRC